MPKPTSLQRARKNKTIKAYAVCFSLNKKCMQGNITVFSKRKEAKQYITESHKKIGGFEDDHHIVSIRMNYQVIK